MSVPRLLVLTDRRACSRPLVDVVAAAVQGGATAVVLRERDLSAGARQELADALRAVLAPVDGLLVLAGPTGSAAVHLAATDPVPVPRPALVGRSCHDRVEVLAATGCNWVTVSPVWPTPSKPGYGPAVGEAGLARLCRLPGAPPVLALGGLTPLRVAGCLAAGAHGVAVLGGVMRAADPAREVAALLRELPSGGPTGSYGQHTPCTGARRDAEPGRLP